MPTPIKIKSTVSSIDTHSESCFTVKLRPARGVPRFKPGQFLHLALDSFNPSGGYWPESRVFSIASTPFESEIAIAYSVKGAFTKRMKEELEIGKEVWLKLPYGHFIISPEKAEDVVLVAGGTGITPFIPFIKENTNKKSNRKISLVYGVRKPELFIFSDVISNAMSKLSEFRVYAFCEDMDNNYLNFNINKGRLTVDAILDASPGVNKSDYYLSGPMEMIKTFREDLISVGINKNNIHIDEWE